MASSTPFSVSPILSLSQGSPEQVVDKENAVNGQNAGVSTPASKNTGIKVAVQTRTTNGKLVEQVCVIQGKNVSFTETPHQSSEETGSKLLESITISDRAEAASWNSSGTAVVVGDESGTLHLFTNQGQLLFSKQITEPTSAGAAFVGISFVPCRDSTSQSEELVVVTKANTIIRIGALRLGNLIDGVMANDNTLMASVQESLTTEVVSVAKVSSESTQITSHVLCTTPSGVTKLILCGSGDCMLSVWDVPSHKKIVLEGSIPQGGVLNNTASGVQVGITLNGTLVVLLDSDGCLSFWDLSTLLLVAHWNQVFVHAFAVLESTSLVQKEVRNQLVVIASSRSPSIPFQQGVYTCDVTFLAAPQPTKVCTLTSCDSSLLALASSSEHFDHFLLVGNKSLVDETSSSKNADDTYSAWIMRCEETKPALVLERMIRHGEFQRALAWATEHDLDEAKVHKAHLFYLIGQAEQLQQRGGTVEPAVEKAFLNKVVGILDNLADFNLEFVLQGCINIQLPKVQLQGDLLEYAKRLCERKGAPEHLQQLINQVLFRWTTFSLLISPTEDEGRSVAVWHSMRQASTNSLLLETLMKGRLHGAKIVWRRHALPSLTKMTCTDSATATASPFSPTEIVRFLEQIPEHIPGTNYAPWIQEEILPHIHSRSARDQIAAWAFRRAMSLTSEQGPLAALQIASIFAIPQSANSAASHLNSNLNSDTTSKTELSSHVVTTTTHAIGYISPGDKIEQTRRAGQEQVMNSKMSSSSVIPSTSWMSNADDGIRAQLERLRRRLNEMVYLHQKHNLEIEFSAFEQLETEQILQLMLSRVDAPELLPAAVQHHLRPCALRYGMEVDDVLERYIGMVAQEDSNAQYGTEQRLITLIGCIRSIHSKAKAVLAIMRNTLPPYSTEFMSLVSQAQSWGTRYDAELSEQERLMRLRGVVRQYKMRRFNFADEQEARYLVAHILANSVDGQALEHAKFVASAYASIDQDEVLVLYLQNLPFSRAEKHDPTPSQSTSQLRSKTLAVMKQLKDEVSTLSVGQEALSFLLDSLDVLEDDGGADVSNDNLIYRNVLTVAICLAQTIQNLFGTAATSTAMESTNQYSTEYASLKALLYIDINTVAERLNALETLHQLFGDTASPSDLESEAFREMRIQQQLLRVATYKEHNNSTTTESIDSSQVEISLPRVGLCILSFRQLRNMFPLAETLGVPRSVVILYVANECAKAGLVEATQRLCNELLSFVAFEKSSESPHIASLKQTIAVSLLSYLCRHPEKLADDLNTICAKSDAGVAASCCSVPQLESILSLLCDSAMSCEQWFLGDALAKVRQALFLSDAIDQSDIGTYRASWKSSSKLVALEKAQQNWYVEQANVLQSKIVFPQLALFLFNIQKTRMQAGPCQDVVHTPERVTVTKSCWDTLVRQLWQNGAEQLALSLLTQVDIDLVDESVSMAASKTMSMLATKTLSATPVDTTLTFAYLVSLSSVNQSFELFRKALPRAKSEFERLRRLACVGMDLGLVSDQKILFNDCVQMERSSYWWNELSRLEVPFDFQQFSDSNPDRDSYVRELVIPLLEKSNLDFATARSFERDFELPKGYAASNFLGLVLQDENRQDYKSVATQAMQQVDQCSKLDIQESLEQARDAISGTDHRRLAFVSQLLVRHYQDRGNKNCVEDLRRDIDVLEILEECSTLQQPIDFHELKVDPWGNLRKQLNQESVGRLVGLSGPLGIDPDEFFVNLIQEIAESSKSPESGNSFVQVAFARFEPLFSKVRNKELAFNTALWLAAQYPMNQEKVECLTFTVQLGITFEREDSQRLEDCTNQLKDISTRVDLDRLGEIGEELLPFMSEPREMVCQLYHKLAYQAAKLLPFAKGQELEAADIAALEGLPAGQLGLHVLAETWCERYDLPVTKIRHYMVQQWLTVSLLVEDSALCDDDGKNPNSAGSNTDGHNISLLDFAMQADSTRGHSQFSSIFDPTQDEKRQAEEQKLVLAILYTLSSVDREQSSCLENKKSIAFLLNFVFQKKNKLVTHEARSRALHALFTLAPADSIATLDQASPDNNNQRMELPTYWQHCMYMAEFEHLHIKLTTSQFVSCDKHGLARSLWRDHRESPRVLRVIVDLVIDFGVVDHELFGAVLQRLLDFGHHRALMFVVLRIASLPELLDESTLLVLWEALVLEPFLELGFQITTETAPTSFVLPPSLKDLSQSQVGDRVLPILNMVIALLEQSPFPHRLTCVSRIVGFLAVLDGSFNTAPLAVRCAMCMHDASGRVLTLDSLVKLGFAKYVLDFVNGQVCSENMVAGIFHSVDKYKVFESLINTDYFLPLVEWLVSHGRAHNVVEWGVANGRKEQLERFARYWFESRGVGRLDPGRDPIEALLQDSIDIVN